MKEDNESVEFVDPAEVRYSRLAEWCHPVYPPDLKAAGVDGEYRVRFVVDATGAVTELEAVAGDERFKDVAFTALAGWKYKPLVIRGHGAPFASEILFTFDHLATLRDPKQSDPPYQFQEVPTMPPEGESVPDPVYPKYLGGRHLFGEVELNMSIEKNGRVSGVEILRATHPDFVTAALTTIEQWKFRPAMTGRVPRFGKKGAVLSFVVLDHENGLPLRDDWLGLNGIKLRASGNPDPALYFVEVPTPTVLVDPVYPADLRERGITGTTRAQFTVGKDGGVTEIKVTEASDPAFGDSLGAALATWEFKPLYHDGENVSAEFEIRWDFRAPVEGSPEARLLATTEKPVGAGHLDKVPGLLYACRPVYPAEAKAKGESGQASIEVVIDRDGRVCFPRVVSATDPAFGWAAVTAASRWYFETPRLHGAPSDTKVVIPMVFKPQ